MQSLLFLHTLSVYPLEVGLGGGHICKWQKATIFLQVDTVLK